jgi:hypothetical protein
MKKMLLLIIGAVMVVATYAQPAALMDLWRTVDGVQYFYLQRAIDEAYFVSNELPENNRRVESFGLPFGGTYASTIQRLVEDGYTKEYMLTDDIACKMRGGLFGDKCSVFVGGVGNVVYQYYYLFDEEYKDFAELKKAFAKCESALNNVFGKPCLEGRSAEEKYFPISAIKNDSGILYGNIYQSSDGMVYLTPVRCFSVSGHGEGVKIAVYFMHNKSLEKAINK